MQITNSYRNGAFPPSIGEGAPGLARQRQSQKMRHLRILWLRSIQFWWYRMLLIVLGSLAAVVLGQNVLDYPKEILGGAAVLVLFFWAIRRLEFGLILLAIFATAFTPKAASVKSVDLYPVEILLTVLFFVILVQTAFHARRFIWPSFWTVWPQMGLIVLAIVSTIVIQYTWIPLVPRRINNTPIIYSEVLGIVMYSIPLITVIVTTACLTNKEQWVERVQNAFLALAALAAIVIGVEFRRIGADIYTFRYTEPIIIYMSLRSLSQLLGLGAMIAYVRLLHTKHWRMRVFYAALGATYLIGVYFALENSWWLEVAVALLVITIVYSRRLFLLFCVLGLPTLPFMKNELAKLQSVKAADYYRLIVWQDILRVWSKRPVLGVGPGNLWQYDQVYTHLPVLLRNFDTTGLGVAHNGILQTLGELGPMGVFFLFSFIAVILWTGGRMFRRSRAPEERNDRMLGLICIGLVCGSVAGDFFAGSFFLPPRQIGSFNDLPQVLTTWMMFGCLIYKDQLWRLAQRRVKIK